MAAALVAEADAAKERAAAAAVGQILVKDDANDNGEEKVGNDALSEDAEEEVNDKVRNEALSDEEEEETTETEEEMSEKIGEKEPAVDETAGEHFTAAAYCTPTTTHTDLAVVESEVDEIN